MATAQTDPTTWQAAATLVARYCRAVDQGDEALLATLWTDDAVFDSLVRRDGRAAILSYFEPILRDRKRTTKHLVTNVEVDPVGADELDVRAAFQFTMASAAGLSIAIGTYRDRLVRSDDGWLLAAKVVRFDIPLTSLTAPTPDDARP
jgi:uncharacterized protein (TIGR02246 family)